MPNGNEPEAVQPNTLARSSGGGSGYTDLGLKHWPDIIRAADSIYKLAALALLILGLGGLLLGLVLVRSDKTTPGLACFSVAALAVVTIFWMMTRLERFGATGNSSNPIGDFAAAAFDEGTKLILTGSDLIATAVGQVQPMVEGAAGAAIDLAPSLSGQAQEAATSVLEGIGGLGADIARQVTQVIGNVAGNVVQTFTQFFYGTPEAPHDEPALMAIEREGLAAIATPSITCEAHQVFEPEEAFKIKSSTMLQNP